jgi:hypothetical protein
MCTLNPAYNKKKDDNNLNYNGNNDNKYNNNNNFMDSVEFSFLIWKEKRKDHVR